MMMSTWTMYSMLDSASPTMENIILFHDMTILILIFIMTLIFLMMYMLMKMTMSNRMFINNQLIEILWTIIPVMTLIMLASPSLKTLYLTEEVNFPTLTFKAIGHQWYWEYQINEFDNLKFDSYMIKNYSMNKNFRLLDVDYRLITPLNTQFRMMTTSDDVIHSFTLPSLGMKMDSIPGRLNQIYMLIKRPGLFFGQCSEICGINHGFMPIVMEVTSLKICLSFYKNLI
uniref:Cytochrome c oxidase subunit 2 n=1 Tax=Exallonyx sp. ZJUH_2016014 TaxID=2491158 RepID=A0A3Q8UA04_9HYME|nr:cytochrome c oxidase subunit 2 [Exallonyx sp. ZJUH_2016014]